jgi:hypothetical protein
MSQSRSATDPGARSCSPRGGVLPVLEHDHAGGRSGGGRLAVVCLFLGSRVFLRENA